MTRRINARLDEELAQKLDQLGKLTGKSATEIIKAALEAYCARSSLDEHGAMTVLRASGFIGCASGDPDLSTRYKEQLTASWSKKA